MESTKQPPAFNELYYSCPATGPSLYFVCEGDYGTTTLLEVGNVMLL